MLDLDRRKESFDFEDAGVDAKDFEGKVVMVVSLCSRGTIAIIVMSSGANSSGGFPSNSVPFENLRIVFF